MTTVKPFQLGSISTGTLRTVDLIPTFALKVCKLGHPKTWSAIVQANTATGGTDADLLESLTNVLNDACPPFVYFGTHHGDSADFGFWPDMEALEEERRFARDCLCHTCDCHQEPYHNCPVIRNDFGDCSSLDNDEAYLPESNVIVQISDHGNVTVMDMARNVLWSTV